MRGSSLRTWIVLTLLLPGCARVPRVASPEGTRVAFERQVRERAGLLEAVRLEGRVEFDGRATGPLPALVAQAHLAGAEGLRLRARWLLGTAADILVRGDSVVVWLPSERLAFTLAETGRSLGVGPAGDWATRVLAGVWSPPASAWREARATARGFELRWTERGDSLLLTLDASGTPLSGRQAREDRSVEVRYDQWREVEGVRWPHAVRLADDAGWFSCALVLDAAHFPGRPRRDWWELRLPEDARRIGWPELRAWLTDLGVGG